MHEYSIVQELLEKVEAQARAHGAHRVHKLHVRIGELSGVEADLLASAFEMLRESTVCDGAELLIHPVKTSWTCPECGTWLAAGEILTCGRCGVPARLTAGDEILLERIEMEVR